MTIQSKPKTPAKKVVVNKATTVTKKVVSKPKKPVPTKIPLKNLTWWQKLVMFLTRK